MNSEEKVVVKYLIRYSEYEKLVNSLIKKIKKSKKEFDAVYGIPRGGLCLAVELSHKLNPNRYSHHDSYFYEIFTKLCPKHLQHFELEYKKTSSKYGISKNN